MDHIYELLNLQAFDLTDEKRISLVQELSGIINDLINNDFNQLIQILYRVDVSENKLKKLLSEHNGQEASNIIANLLIDRQMEKYHNKMKEPPSSPISDEEKW